MAREGHPPQLRPSGTLLCSGLCASGAHCTVEDGGWVVEEGVVGKEEQVGAVGPGQRVEEQLPGTLWHLGSILRPQVTPFPEWLRGEGRGEAQRGGAGVLVTPPFVAWEELAMGQAEQLPTQSQPQPQPGYSSTWANSPDTS